MTYFLLSTIYLYMYIWKNPPPDLENRRLKISFEYVYADADGNQTKAIPQVNRFGIILRVSIGWEIWVIQALSFISFSVFKGI